MFINCGAMQTSYSATSSSKIRVFCGTYIKKLVTVQREQFLFLLSWKEKCKTLWPNPIKLIPESSSQVSNWRYPICITCKLSRVIGNLTSTILKKIDLTVMSQSSLSHSTAFFTLQLESQKNEFYVLTRINCFERERFFTFERATEIRGHD